MKRRTIIVVLVIVFSRRGPAQTFVWSAVSLSSPPSVKVYAGAASGPIRAWYAEVDYSDTLIAAKALLSTESDGKEPVSTMGDKVRAYVAINGGFFGGTPAQSYSLVVSDGNLSAKQIATVTRTQGTYYITRANFVVRSNRTFETAWIYHFGNTLNDIYRYTAPLPNTTSAPAPAPQQSNGTVWANLLNAIGGGPNLVSNGQVNITYDEEVMFGSGVGLDNGDPRTAIGYTVEGKVILFVADGRSAESIGMSLTQVAQTMVNLGCVEAINLDGGGSSTFYAGGNVLNQPSDGSERQVSSCFAVLPLPGYDKSIDTDDPGYSEQGTGWVFSANAGYFGQMAARINPVGNGSDRAKFRLNLPKQSMYELYAWWVVANNRATDTPFLIYSKGRVDTIRVDQTSGGSAWIKLGEFTFTGTSADSIVITDAATSGGTTTYVVVDGIRVVSYDLSFATSVSRFKVRPAQFLLEQNFPNPFNPETTIRYHVSKAGMVTLKLFDLLGREVTTLVHGFLDTGTFSVTWDGTDNARRKVLSGVYFCTLNAAGFTQTKKMILLQ